MHLEKGSSRRKQEAPFTIFSGMSFEKRLNEHKFKGLSRSFRGTVDIVYLRKRRDLRRLATNEPKRA